MAGTKMYNVGDKMTTTAGRVVREKEDREYVSVPDPGSQWGRKMAWKKIPAKYTYQQYEWNGSDWISSGTSDLPNKENHYSSVADAPTHIEGGSKEWGAANITAEDFIYEEGHEKAGEQRPIAEVASRLDPKLPNITGDKLLMQIKDMAPKYVGADVKEKGFIGEEKELAEKAAGVGRKADVYGLQKEARKLGPAAGGVGMRGRMTGQADIAKGFGAAQDKYGLAMDRADLTARKGEYRLDKGAREKFEGDVGDFIETDWLETPESGVKQLTTDWGLDSYRGGGYVPNKEETFLDILSKLPDAGGS